MKLVSLFCLLIVVNFLLAQDDYINFRISIPSERSESSLYKTIRMLDMRSDIRNVGLFDARKEKASKRLIALPALSIQLNELLTEINPSDGGEGELLLVLYELKMLESNLKMKYKGAVCFSAELYSHFGPTYKRIATIDTWEFLEDQEILTESIMLRQGQLIGSFIKSNLNNAKPLDNIILTENDLTEIDVKMKMEYPLYTSEELTDGIYTNLNSLLYLHPNRLYKKVTMQINQYNSPTDSVDGKPILAIISGGFLFLNHYGRMIQSNRNGLDYRFIARVKSTKYLTHYLPYWQSIKEILVDKNGDVSSEEAKSLEFRFVPRNGTIVPQKRQE
ncbi:MAG: hypothetical protein ACOVP5_01040 [Chitinophagales bacterium]